MKKKRKNRDLTPARKFYKIVSKIIDICMIPVMLLAIFCCFTMFNAKRQNLVPNVLGYSLIVPVSGSMRASGFEPGRTVLVRTANPKGLEVGDIIAYYKYIETGRQINPSKYAVYTAPEGTNKIASLDFNALIGNRNAEMVKAGGNQTPIIFHQIVEIRQDSAGNLWFKTKGTSNPTADSWWVRDVYIVGVYEEVSPILHNIFTFVGSANGIIWLVVIPIAIIMFMLALEFIDNWDRYETEQKLIKGEIYLTDKMCVNKKIGYDMTKQNKLILLARAPDDYKQTYIHLMWKEGEIPKGIVKHYKKQNWSKRETEKLEEIRKQAEEAYKTKKSKKAITEYQNAVKNYNELEYKIRGENYTPSALTMSKAEIEAAAKKERADAKKKQSDLKKAAKIEAIKLEQDENQNNKKRK